MNALIRIYQRELRGKLRVWVSWIFVPLILLSLHQVPRWPGILVLALGTGLRWWASGYLDKEGKLSLAGPYRFSRNPLYLGSILLAAAIPISQDLWILAVLITGISLLVHIPLIYAEEKVLREKFGTDYVQYCEKINRLFSPLLFLKMIFSSVFFSPQKGTGFRWDLHKRNKGNEPLIVGIALLAVTFLIVYTHLDDYFKNVPLGSALDFFLRKTTNLF